MRRKNKKMTVDSEYKEISRLIALEMVQELDDEDSDKLKEWVNKSSENLSLYHRIKDPDNLRRRNQEYEEIDVAAEWDYFIDGIERKKRIQIYKKVLAYAAAILLPVLIAVGVLLDGPKQTKQIAKVQNIKPGSEKALLILENGETVQLDSAKELSIVEKDGTIIKKYGGKIDYTANASETGKATGYNTIRIPRGGEYHLVMADGTTVYMNSMSSLKYPVQFTGQTREVELTGEAYFIVKKDASKPFIVKTAAMNIEVLGTTFNLNAYEKNDKIVTTLVEGSVKILARDDSRKDVLNPGEQAAFFKDGSKTEIRNVDVNLFTAWKDGYFVFRDSRLEDIMTDLTRWYSADVVFNGEAVKNLRFSGKLSRSSSINEILEIIKSNRKVEVQISNNTIAISELN
jgi:ferric-dicitrate binding protein FerR (iron transport regulator)